MLTGGGGGGGHSARYGTVHMRDQKNWVKGFIFSLSGMSHTLVLSSEL